MTADPPSLIIHPHNAMTPESGALIPIEIPHAFMLCQGHDPHGLSFSQLQGQGLFHPQLYPQHPAQCPAQDKCTLRICPVAGGEGREAGTSPCWSPSLQIHRLLFHCLYLASTFLGLRGHQEGLETRTQESPSRGLVFQLLAFLRSWQLLFQDRQPPHGDIDNYR